MDAKAPSFDGPAPRWLSLAVAIDLTRDLLIYGALAVLRRVAVDTEVVVVALGPKDKPAEARHKDSEWMQSFFPRIV